MLQERERRGARLRQQQADAELDGLTFRPTLATRGRRPGSAPCRPAPSSSLYDRERAHRQRLQERHAQQRRQQEEEALAGCTFRPAIDARSAQLCSRGVRYGHGRVHARGASPEGGACMDETVRQQVRERWQRVLALLRGKGSRLAMSCTSEATLTHDSLRACPPMSPPLPRSCWCCTARA